MSTTEAPFAGKQTSSVCPNCGNPLFSGLADGNVLVCRDAEGNGCQLAIDPDHPTGQTAAAVSPPDATPSPEVGPPNEAEPQQADQAYADATGIMKAWEPPTSAPQAQNVAPEEAAPSPSPTAPKSPPAPPTPPAPDTQA